MLKSLVNFPNLLIAVLLSSVAAVGCGGGGDTVEGPSVMSVFPSAAAGQQDRDVILRVTYDGPIQVGSGRIVGVEADDTPINGLSLSFVADPTTINVNPPGGRWPANTTITVTISDVQGANGGVAEQAVIVFETIDDERPTIVRFTPGNRATVTDVRSLVAFQLEFSEPMNTAAGLIEQIEPDIEWFDYEARSWNEEGTVLTVPRAGDGLVQYREDYRYNLSNFVDQAGNVTDPPTQAYLFNTGADNQAPRVLASTPNEGQLDVDPQLPAIVVRFDEQMSGTRRSARLEADGEDLGMVPGEWDGPFREITFSMVDGNGQTRLRQNSPHRLILSLLQDTSGNPPSADPNLGGDNALDFTTGIDMAVPGVVSVNAVIDVGGIPTDVDLSEPALNIDYPRLLSIEVQFTETMDPTAVTEFEIVPDGGDGQVIAHTWELSDTRLVFDPASVALDATTLYAIDLSGMRDLAGNALAPESLGDNNLLEFTTRAPSGENCSEPLSTRDASLTGGVFTWNVGPGSALFDDGGTDSCDADGSGADVVIQYVKTTPALSEDPTAGRLLRVRTASSSASQGYNLQVLRGACAPTDGAAEELHCVTGQSLDDMGMPTTGRDLWEKELDVGPGTYYVWVSGPIAALPMGQVQIEEVAAPTEGESCLAPYDDSSATYFPPVGSGDPAVWSIPIASANGVDRTRSNGATFDCDGDAPTNVGVDIVIEFQKENAASYLDVTVDAEGSRVNILGACDAEATEAVAFCSERADDHRFRGGAFLPAGPVYIWVAADRPVDDLPAVNVDVIERTISMGEGCQAANPISSTGTVSVGTLDSTQALDVPGCFTGGGNIEWWSYEAVNEVIAFDPNRTTRMAVVDRATGQVISCDEFAGDYALGGIVDSGETVCLAIPTTSSVTSFTVTDSNYTGVAGTRTDLGVSFPSGVSISEDRFLANGADDLYLGYFQSGSGGGARVLEFAKDGSGTPTVRGSTDGVTSTTTGRGGVVVDGELFSTNTSRSSTGSRLYRLYDGSSWGSEAWDAPAPTWPVDGVGVVAATLTTDGTNLWFGLLRDTFSTAEDTAFYRRTAASSGTPTEVGQNINVYGVRALAADDTYLYFTGILDNGDRSGVYRVPQSNVAATPTSLTPALTFREPLPTGLALDDLADPEYLYVRTSSPPGIHVIQNPDGASPAYLGIIADVSGAGGAMAYDDAGNAIYVYEALGGTPAVVKIE